MIKFILGFLTAILLLWIIAPETTYINYDCSVVEFHPDIPNEIKEQCRLIRNRTIT